MANLQGLQPAVRTSLGNVISQFKAAGIPWNISPRGAFRTYADQQALYAGRATNPNPVAPPGTSDHEKGIAVDFSFGPASPYTVARAHQILQQNGFSNPLPNDPSHFVYGVGNGGGGDTRVTSQQPASAPSSLTPLQQMAWNTAQQHGIPPARFLGLIQTESGFNPNARSSAGAVGLGQLMPGTAAGLGVKDRLDPQQNLDASARYYRQHFDKFGDWDVASAAYNQGPGAIVGGKIPPSAVGYVDKVNQNIQQWKGLDGGGSTAPWTETVPIQPISSAPPQTTDAVKSLIQQTRFGTTGPVVAPASVALPGTPALPGGPAAMGIQGLINQARFGKPTGS